MTLLPTGFYDNHVKSPTPLLQVVHALDPQAGGEIGQYAWEVAQQLGGWVLSLTPQAQPEPPAWGGLHVITPAAGESLIAAWHRALDIAQPQAVFVQSLGAMSPALLLDLRERSIPYAVFLHDFTPLCPTQRLWHRSEDRCSGPGRTGWKCAWCVSGELRRMAELPLRMVLYRHRPQDWRTALVRAEALVASSRFARDFWIEQGAPPERIAVIAPRLGLDHRTPSPSPPNGARRRLLYAGGPGHASGAELLGAALDQMPEPLQLDLLNVQDEEAQLRLRAAFAPHHQVVFHPPIPPAEMPALLSACGVAVVPSRWEQPFSRLIADAQAAGACVVATAIGGLAEQIIHGVNGFLAAPDDAIALADALREAFAAREGWDGDRVAKNAQAQALASVDALRSLFDLLARGATEPDPALALEHGAWLAQQAGRDHTTPLEAAQKLALALRHGEESSPDYEARAFATTRRWRMEMNHAIAFFRGCGCHRIASVGPHPPAPIAVESFSTWGLELVPAQDLPDGLWFEGDNPNPDLLQHRFPQAKALVASLPEGMETLDWTDDLTES